MNNRKYFAYGSNMDRQQMKSRCPGAVPCGVAELKNYKFALDEVGYATVIPCTGYSVKGVIWEISDVNECSLDRYEGVSLGCYKKEYLEVFPKGEKVSVPVLVYTSLRGKNNGSRVPFYMDRIVDAADEFGFGESYTAMLKDIWVGRTSEDDRLEFPPANALEKAFDFAARAHYGACRKGTDIPYILHPAEAAAIVGTMTTDRCALAAAVLHDVLEDTDVTFDELCSQFGRRIAELVAAESENKRENLCATESWKLRKQETLDRLHGASLEEKMIALGDKLANMRAIKRDFSVLGDSFWTRFNVSDPALHAWYYCGLVDALSELDSYPVYKEYKQLVDDVFSRYLEVDAFYRLPQGVISKLP